MSAEDNSSKVARLVSAAAERDVADAEQYLEGCTKRLRQVKEELFEIRKQAWKTRREKYGERWHKGSYVRSCSACHQMQRTIIKYHNEGILTEGQACKATGLDRVSLRRIADELKEKG